MIPKRTLYQYVAMMILSVPIIIAAKLGYHLWINDSTIAQFNFDKAYFVATVISVVIFISSIRTYKNHQNPSI
jgi:predicted ABC-type exoprotein transport system permease subunit